MTTELEDEAPCVCPHWFAEFAFFVTGNYSLSVCNDSYSLSSSWSDSDSSDSAEVDSLAVCLLSASNYSSSSSSSSDLFDSSDSSDSTTVSNLCRSAAGSSSSSSSIVERRRRRRGLLSDSISLFDSDSDDSSSSIGGGGMSIVAATEVLLTVCVTYTMGQICPDLRVTEVALELCVTNDTTYNASALTTDDLLELVSDATFGQPFGSNIASVRAEPISGTISGTLPYLVVTLANPNITSFTLCLDDATMTADNLHLVENPLDLEYYNETCSGVGLPCLNWFFPSQCPSNVSGSSDSNSDSSDYSLDYDDDVEDVVLEELADDIVQDLLAFLEGQQTEEEEEEEEEEDSD